jgi:hypothetical protein
VEATDDFDGPIESVAAAAGGGRFEPAVDSTEQLDHPAAADSLDWWS